MYVIRLNDHGQYSYVFNHRMQVHSVELARTFTSPGKAISYFKKSQFCHLSWQILEFKEAQSAIQH